MNFFQHDPGWRIHEVAQHPAVRGILRIVACAIDLSGEGVGAEDEVAAGIHGKDRDKDEHDGCGDTGRRSETVRLA